jgi:hypothetical protein
MGGLTLMSKMIAVEDFEALTDEIGKAIYIDVAKWHLYLAEAHLDKLLAERLSPLLQQNTVNEQQVTQILADIPVKVGGGKREISLLDLVPTQCQANLLNLLEEFQRRL